MIIAVVAPRTNLVAFYKHDHTSITTEKPDVTEVTVTTEMVTMALRWTPLAVWHRSLLPTSLSCGCTAKNCCARFQLLWAEMAKS